MRVRVSCLMVLLPLLHSGPAEAPANPLPLLGAAARLADSIVPVDHHAHLMSPALVRDWKSLGVPFSRPDSVYVSAAPLMARVRHAVLVPMSHLYTNTEFRGALGLSLADERERVRRENDHVAAEAARYAGRAVALCSVNPLRRYTARELERCRTDLHTSGVKVHVASSGIDLRRDDHLAALATVAGWAERYGLPLLLHLDPQMRGHDTTDIVRFATAVLDPHPTLVVLVAHLGGSGGYSAWTQSVFRTLTAWLAGRPDRRLYFDVSAVVLARESEGVPATTAAEARVLANDLRRLGVARLVFGSDYPVFDPVAYATLLRERLGFTPAELDALLANRVPGL